MAGMTGNLRDWEPSEGKDVRETKMLNTTARECTAKDTDNPQREYVTSGSGNKGPSGPASRGRN